MTDRPARNGAPGGLMADLFKRVRGPERRM